MAESAPKSKSAMETLVDSFSDMIETAKKRMSPEESRRAEKEFDEVINYMKRRQYEYGHSTHEPGDTGNH
jgi:hypothetical protein